MGIWTFLVKEQSQILCTSIACLSLISDNMQVSWSSPVTPKLKKPDSPIRDFDDEASWMIQNLYLIGGFVGLPMTMYLVDKIGRKPSIMLASASNLISWTLISLASNKPLLYSSRFLGGVSSAINFVAVSIYIAEIADKKIRGFLSSFNSMCGVLGVILMYSVAPFVSIRTSALLGVGVNFVQLISFVFIPESPYFLIKKLKYTESKKSLRFLRNQDNVETEFEEIKKAVERQEKDGHKILVLFLDKGNRKATLIGCVLYIVEHFGCVTIILMNLQTILEEAEGSIQPEIASILFAIVTLISCIIGMCLIDRIGRKLLLFSSIVTTAFFLSSIATYFVLKDNNYNVSNFNFIPIMCIIFYGLCVKGGVEMVPVIITAELFPTNIKAIGLAFADVLYMAFSLATLYIYQALRESLGIYSPLYLYSIVCALIGIFVLFYVPETNKKTLEEIQFELKGLRNGNCDVNKEWVAKI